MAGAVAVIGSVVGRLVGWLLVSTVIVASTHLVGHTSGPRGVTLEQDIVHLFCGATNDTDDGRQTGTRERVSEVWRPPRGKIVVAVLNILIGDKETLQHGKACEPTHTYTCVHSFLHAYMRARTYTDDTSPTAHLDVPVHQLQRVEVLHGISHVKEHLATNKRQRWRDDEVVQDV
jgi:hypothetical protein